MVWQREGKIAPALLGMLKMLQSFSFTGRSEY